MCSYFSHLAFVTLFTVLSRPFIGERITLFDLNSILGMMTKKRSKGDSYVFKNNTCQPVNCQHTLFHKEQISVLCIDVEYKAEHAKVIDPLYSSCIFLL